MHGWKVNQSYNTVIIYVNKTCTVYCKRYCYGTAGGR